MISFNFDAFRKGVDDVFFLRPLRRLFASTTSQTGK
jgi:hypothetical protein